MSHTLDNSFLQSVESKTSSQEKLEEESYFQKLYNQKKQDLLINTKSLFADLNLESSEDSDPFIKEEQDCVSDYTLFVSNILNLPLTQVYYQSQTNPIQFSKLLEKARRQVKRQQAKIRNSSKIKIKIEPISTASSTNDILQKKRKKANGSEIQVKEEEHSGNKRQMQMIRNRVSAQNSRDKKKLYMKRLEEENQQYSYERIMQFKKIEVLQKDLEFSREQCDCLSRKILELQYQKRPEQQEQQICFDCGSQNIGRQVEYLEDKNNSMQKSHFNKLGFAFLSVLTIVALVSTQISVEHSSNFLKSDTSYQKIDFGNQTYFASQKSNQSRVLTEEDPDYALYNTIVERRKENNVCKLDQLSEVNSIKCNQRNAVDVFGKAEDSVDFSQGLVSGLIKKSKQRQDQKQKNTMLAPLSFCDKEAKMQTLYCPAAEKLDDHNKQLKYAEWIQLLIPKENLTTFYQNLEDKSITIKKQEESQARSGRVISEILCQVKSINEIFIS